MLPTATARSPLPPEVVGLAPATAALPVPKAEAKLKFPLAALAMLFLPRAAAVSRLPARAAFAALLVRKAVARFRLPVPAWARLVLPMASAALKMPPAIALLLAPKATARP